MNQDFQLDADGDLLIENGDFVVGDSDQQHVKDITLMYPGELRQYPLIGFGASRFMKASTTDSIRFVSELKAALKADGYSPKKVDISEGIEAFTVEL